ncbi:cupin domain-containing protein [Phreatobacter sp.]|uniref:cupin domain-containing protein n=1 Tax=Phreatobacter sp. TaxID=1966341 RepID=UPI003F72C695
MTLAADAFALAFGRMSVEDGLQLREACAPRHLKFRSARRFAQVLSIADLDGFLNTDAAQAPRVAMADSGRNGSAAVPDEDFTHEDGRVDPVRLFRLFDGGATLIVSQFHELHRPLAGFCRGLERVFLHPVQANIYLTPPGAQGFRTHFDSHDVLVLQVSGEKKWRYWDHQPVPFATNRTPWDGQAYAPDASKAKHLTLKAGDALYLPRGVLHDAAAQPGGEPSLHITVGLMEPTWGDALKAMIDQLEATTPALREAFPVWRLAEEAPRAALAGLAAERLQGLATDESLDLASMFFLERLALDRLPLPGRGLVVADPKASERLVLADSLHHYVVPLGDGAELRWAGGTVPLTAVELGWLQKLETGATAKALGGAAALDFCKRLVRQGILVRAV